MDAALIFGLIAIGISAIGIICTLIVYLLLSRRLNEHEAYIPEIQWAKLDVKPGDTRGYGDLYAGLTPSEIEEQQERAQASHDSASAVTASVDDKWANQFGNGRGGLPAEENWDAQQAAAEEVTRRVGQGKDKEQVKSEQLGGIH